MFRSPEPRQSPIGLRTAADGDRDDSKSRPRGTTVLSTFGFQRLVETRIDAPGVAFVDLVTVLGAEVSSRLDVALSVVVIMAGLRVDAAYRPDHLAGEQDVVDRDHLGQEIDARL